MDETDYLLSTEANKERLDAAIANIETGNLKERELITLPEIDKKS